MFDTPILFIIFNRLESSKKVFSEIRKQRPKFLFIAADGPRPDFEGDQLKCKMVRSAIMENIDWDCEVKTLFRETNLGCGEAVSSAIDWFFENIESGIILEDDCLPHPSFFEYCSLLLRKYKDNSKIFGISGTNFQIDGTNHKSSYYFSNYISVWGWATWKRAWQHYNFEMENYEKLATTNFFKRIDKRVIFRQYWKSKFDKVNRKKIDTWDYQWLFAIWKNEGLIIMPKFNLISNIGFGSEATHTKNKTPIANLITKNLKILNHPKKVSANKWADKQISFTVFQIKNNKISIYNKIWIKFKKYLR